MPLYSHIFTLIAVLIFAVLRNFFSKKNTKNFSKPYITKFLLFITFLSNNCSTKALKFSKQRLLRLRIHIFGAFNADNVKNAPKFSLFVEKFLPEGSPNNSEMYTQEGQFFEEKIYFLFLQWVRLQKFSILPKAVPKHVIIFWDVKFD